eukprot:scaffold28754_cov58-Phaeocystis_antarctica.AAC.4
MTLSGQTCIYDTLDTVVTVLAPVDRRRPPPGSPVHIWKTRVLFSVPLALERFSGTRWSLPVFWSSSTRHSPPSPSRPSTRQRTGSLPESSLAGTIGDAALEGALVRVDPLSVGCPRPGCGHQRASGRGASAPPAHAARRPERRRLRTGLAAAQGRRGRGCVLSRSAGRTPGVRGLGGRTLIPLSKIQRAEVAFLPRRVLVSRARAHAAAVVEPERARGKSQEPLTNQSVGSQGLIRAEA